MTILKTSLTLKVDRCYNIINCIFLIYQNCKRESYNVNFKRNLLAELINWFRVKSRRKIIIINQSCGF